MNINILFKLFILDTIKELPTEKREILNQMDLDKVFSTEFADWKKTIKKILNLSDTIEIAIKDLWLRNSEIAKQKNIELNAEQFADLFIENYMAENSRVDIWENESDLIDAKQRISESALAE